MKRHDWTNSSDFVTKSNIWISLFLFFSFLFYLIFIQYNRELLESQTFEVDKILELERKPGMKEFETGERMLQLENIDTQSRKLADEQAKMEEVCTCSFPHLLVWTLKFIFWHAIASCHIWLHLMSGIITWHFFIWHDMICHEALCGRMTWYKKKKIALYGSAMTCLVMSHEIMRLLKVNVGETLCDFWWACNCISVDKSKTKEVAWT